ncbi:hypothetical protein SNOG_03144 [Parastagonospora nodorum SN15]|uniref:Uncharacterized protein n=1 Tax=Phaeosphaeria nodorum (strain SN15 / ATCC MYA-4574 / FGSC 10173) TaxID=321614 RepID=Q0UYM0_PHANO|nr:hypothetical protein SNOG_03144 [Parastagonospora nodorum SN15]EAT89875.1 hypothetical protein SNOG_03144 [Parastagonospora nodorum SN15]
MSVLDAFPRVQQLGRPSFAATSPHVGTKADRLLHNHHFEACEAHVITVCRMANDQLDLPLL